MRASPLLLIALLVACQPQPTLTTTPTYRDPRALIASKADFAPDRMAGTWHEVARYPGGPGPDCNRRTLRFGSLGGGSLAVAEGCDTTTEVTGRTDPTGPGRLDLILHGETQSVWVLWIDTGYRTAILVQPDGTGGRILNRDPAIPADRLRAALDVLDFNGFDTGQLTYPTPN
ncbi:lipocalin family protein [Jannaschia pohangensis]|uniref:Apolipoprotein D and lipocalin family protein n=1 Tax=Jannaschia pohangensis TaxID=390807 RepID=A0A1I3LVR1_9RHOB|nr:lipocalin family protein [Jannaschia pohangensis]SFI88650.1 apolipoprotein D and lipocalin family protein [Jannaschia pohangensis]